MAWEDRSPAEKRAARRAAAEYDRTDDGKRYKVTDVAGSILYVTGIHSARVVAGATGRVEEV
jgi:hypothetical protein